MGGEGQAGAFKRDAKEKVVRAELEGLLADSALDDGDLRTKLEELARCHAFGGLTWLWGPELYQRNRVLFRPFILSNFSSFSTNPGVFRGWGPVAWKGEVARRCEPWMEQCDELLDMVLFDRLWTWKHTGDANAWNRRAKVFGRRLVSRVKEAGTTAQRVQVYRNFRAWFPLSEETACELYRIDPMSGSEFLRNHRIPTSYWSGDSRVLWGQLLALAEAEGDRKLAGEVYRRTVPFKTWRADLLRTCEEVEDPEELNKILIDRHPKGYLKDVGEVFVAILKSRGREVLPYVRSHLRNVKMGILFRGAYKDLVALAAEREWWDLWTATVRIVGGRNEFNAAVREVLALPEAEARERLAMLGGVSRELNWAGIGLALVSPLEDETATALHARFPEILRRVFRANLEGMPPARKPQFLDALLAAGDEDLIDFLASRQATRAHFWQRKGREQVDQLADYYDGLKGDPVAFARRACSVLSRIPAYTIFNYRHLIRENRLARLLFERSPQEFLAADPGLQDLVEAQEIHVMGLAYRLLAMDDPRAREAAAANVEILVGTLLRPLQRRTRLRAFGALGNAATTEEKAARILAKSREALDLPDKFYPKEELVGLIGQLLHRWPSLRGEQEHPNTFRAA